MKKSHLILIGTLVTLIATIMLWARPGHTESSSKTTVTAAETKLDATQTNDAVVTSSDRTTDPTTDPTLAPLSPAAMTIHQALEAALIELQSGDPIRRQAALETLNELLSGPSHDAKAAIAAIMAFLKSGRDAKTGEEFVIGAGGVLDQAPTLRSLLMDHLGSLCVEAGQTEALQIARSVLAKFGSTDEWAISLRNTAWLDPNSHGFLGQKMEQLLDHEAWLQNPTRSMLESFDVIGAIGATNLLPRLERFVANEDAATLWRAGIVALDQFATNHPLEMLQYLQTHPDFMRDRPLQRADLLAKADMTNSQQRALVEAHLQNPQISADERAKIINGLVLQGGFLSHNLLTKPVNYTPESEQKRLTFLHGLGQEWKGSNRFPDLNGAIDELLLTTQLPTE